MRSHLHRCRGKSFPVIAVSHSLVSYWLPELCCTWDLSLIKSSSLRSWKQLRQSSSARWQRLWFPCVIRPAFLIIIRNLSHLSSDSSCSRSFLLFFSNFKHLWAANDETETDVSNQPEFHHWWWSAGAMKTWQTRPPHLALKASHWGVVSLFSTTLIRHVSRSIVI